MEQLINKIQNKYPYEYLGNQLLINGDCLEALKQFPDESVDCVMTSPPYWNLRDYGIDGQLGLESTFQEYINKLCDIFDEVKRVLKKEGTCWVNMGDTYSGSGKGSQKIIPEKTGRKEIYTIPYNKKKNTKLQDKTLLQLPSRFAVEMSNRGWILRNEIIWQKPNAMPSSVRDRFTVDFEKIFFFTKNKKYHFEQQFEPYTEQVNRWGGATVKKTDNSIWDKGTGQNTLRDRNLRPNSEGKNKRTVWQINTKGFSEAHFATYPEALCETPIKAGCPERGVILDPFVGAGTTLIVANKLNRNGVGIELNPEYYKLGVNRVREELRQTDMFRLTPKAKIN